MRYVIVGNSAAAVFAIEALRELDREGEVVLLTDEQEPAYSRCLATHFIAGQVSENKMLLRQGEFYLQHKVDARFGSRVTGIDPARRHVTCHDGGKVSYDRLLVAAGASPQLPDIPGNRAQGVHVLRTLDDARAISLRAGPGRRAVVWGAGPVGLKAAHALLQRGMKANVVAGSPQILSRVMDTVSARLVQRHLEKLGLKFYLNCQVEEILQDNKGGVMGVRLAGNLTLPCSLVIAAKGVRPNTEFLAGAGFETGRGLVVNDYLETSQFGVYAAGDVAETRDLATGARRVNATWPNAAAQGRQAARNMAGCRERYPGSLGMNALELSGLSAITAGLAGSNIPADLEVLESTEEAACNRRRLVFKGDRLVGYVAVGDIAGVGALTARIRTGAAVKDKQSLLRGRPPLTGNWTSWRGVGV